MEVGALPPPFADCESTLSVLAFGNVDIRDQLGLAKGATYPRAIWTILVDSGIFRILRDESSKTPR